MDPFISDQVTSDRASAILLCGLLAAGFVPLVRRIAEPMIQAMVPAERDAARSGLAEAEADALMTAHP